MEYGMTLFRMLSPANNVGVISPAVAPPRLLPPSLPPSLPPGSVECDVSAMTRVHATYAAPNIIFASPGGERMGKGGGKSALRCARNRILSVENLPGRNNTDAKRRRDSNVLRIWMYKERIYCIIYIYGSADRNREALNSFFL